MKGASVKLKLTAWITLLMAALFCLLLVFMLTISSSVAYRTSMDTLIETVKSNLSCVSLQQDGRLQLSDQFSFYRSGVSTLVYSQSESLLAGQLPVSFTASEPFQNGLTRTVEAGGSTYLVSDLWLAQGWEGGVWIRGLMETPAHEEIAQNLLRIAIIALPLFLLLTALGGWMIVKRSFSPLESITQTAAAINEARDLSGRIALPRGKDEFSRLADAFNGMFERLEASFEAERQFTADASHELRTPVSIIKGACEYAEKYDETPQERLETILMIHRQADKMTSLISQLLSMTRLEQGTELAHLQQLSLSDLARSVCLEQAYSPEKVIVQADDPVFVRADAALLSRLVQNLVDNALKYGKPDGHVWVCVSRQDDTALLSVRDDGIGIAPEHREKVWQRFYQVDSSRGGQSGAGLGLSMVRQIAQLHGGTVTLESQPGVGSTFTLRLPAVPAPCGQTPQGAPTP